MSSFQLVHNNPEAEDQMSCAQSAKNRLSLSCNSKPTAQNFSCLLPQGYCKRVLSINLEKMTSSVLSVILINLWTVDVILNGPRPSIYRMG